ncbi:MAG: hypothetical protein J5722_12485 [Oscillospiraceae bacterium]|nr:hypothetical protein [Oscillospiraceae bacterium]
MTELRDDNIRYKELFPVKNCPEQHMRIFIGLAENGDLLYITESEEGMFTDIYLKRRFCRIDKQEYAEYLEQARRRGKLEKAIRRGLITLEEAERYCR